MSAGRSATAPVKMPLIEVALPLSPAV